ncbi:hypothetical protein DAI22_12g167700 [Oryza sativa Japonica Group]|nr:hypothetical protein DAI22_12g167700 [Oryza sativa Japonica Group]
MRPHGQAQPSLSPLDSHAMPPPLLAAAAAPFANSGDCHLFFPSLHHVLSAAGAGGDWSGRGSSGRDGNERLRAVGTLRPPPLGRHGWCVLLLFSPSGSRQSGARPPPPPRSLDSSVGVWGPRIRLILEVPIGY